MGPIDHALLPNRATNFAVGNLCVALPHLQEAERQRMPSGRWSKRWHWRNSATKNMGRMQPPNSFLRLPCATRPPRSISDSSTVEGGQRRIHPMVRLPQKEGQKAFGSHISEQRQETSPSTCMSPSLYA